MARILIIDDEESVRVTLSLALESDGHTVVVAVNGEEGMREFRETPADVVITDILMPNKEGIETIMDLRKVRPNLKIIAISGGGRMKNISFLDVAKKMGADVTLKKPFRMDVICHAVNKCLGATMWSKGE